MSWRLGRVVLLWPRLPTPLKGSHHNCLGLSRPHLLLHGAALGPPPQRPQHGAREAWICTLALPLPGSVTLNNSFHFFDPSSPTLEVRIELQIIY